VTTPDLPPPFALFRMVTGYYISRAIWVAAKLGIADLLVDGPRHYGDLAKATDMHAPSLNRVLRLLASAGIFVEQEFGHFALTPIGGCLRTGVPGSMRAAVLLFGGRTQDTWRELLHSVQTGEPAFPRVWGMDPFTHMEQHPEEAAVFDEAMADWTKHVAIATAAAYDFSPFRTIVDVGGGNGVLLAGILKANPGLRGVLFDRPHVVERGRARLAALGVADRCTVVGGDFFQEVPRGGDAYLLKHVIHDWNDERAGEILASCHRAMRSEAAHHRRCLSTSDRPVGCKSGLGRERREHACLHWRPAAVGAGVSLSLRGGRLRTHADRPDRDAHERDRGPAALGLADVQERVRMSSGRRDVRAGRSARHTGGPFSLGHHHHLVAGNRNVGSLADKARYQPGAGHSGWSEPPNAGTFMAMAPRRRAPARERHHRRSRRGAARPHTTDRRFARRQQAPDR
jgi:O-methyltransferase domain